MNATFITMLYNNRHLILKNQEGKSPFVVAESHSERYAERIAELLNESDQEKSNEASNTKTNLS